MNRAKDRKAEAWSEAQVRALRRLARLGTAESATRSLNRTPASVRQKAFKSGISFRALQPAALRLRSRSSSHPLVGPGDLTACGTTQQSSSEAERDLEKHPDNLDQ
jgi:hypothetical protein